MRRENLLFNQPREVYDLLKEKGSHEYIDTMGYTTESIEDFCKENALFVRQRTNDKTVENKTNPPLMASFFYYYLYCYQILPTQQQFSEFYRALNEKWIRNTILPHQKEGFESRLARFYASIVREFHFYHLAKESGMFDVVHYSLGQDIENKIDCFIKKEGIAYGIQLRVKTANAKKYAEKKSERQFEDSGVVLIDLALDLDNAKIVPTKQDSFLFYDETYIQTVLQTFDKQKEERV